MSSASPSHTERNALLLAGAAHLALFGALSLGWQFATAPLPPAEEMVAVEFVDIADAPRVTEPPKPSMEAAPQETSAPEPEPEAAPAPPVDAVPEPTPKPEPKPKPKVEPKPAVAAKPLDTSTLSNLINKALPKAKTKPLDTSKLATTIAAAQPKNAAVDPRAAATLAQAIQSQVAPCWNPPIGGQDVRRMTVLIHAEFNRDGSLAAPPTIGAQTGRTAGNADYSRAFAETARRAVLRCSPLKLPADLYDLWKSVDINFDPESMT
jgi:outer membrane biosynthesis protein TonB